MRLFRCPRVCGQALGIELHNEETAIEHARIRWLSKNPKTVGLEPGDVILSVNGVEVRYVMDTLRGAQGLSRFECWNSCMQPSDWLF